MQEITVILFGAAADLAGTRTVKLPPENIENLDDVWTILTAKHPGLAPLQTMLAFAVNGEYAGRGAPVAAGDEVAVLPPVSGG